MDRGFRLFPEQASTIAPEVDALYFYLLAVTAFFVILICALILYFGIRFRRSSQVPRKNHRTIYSLEVAWCVVPFVLVMIMFGWGARLYFDLYDPPPGAMIVHVVGKQWMWKTQHPNGRQEIDHLHVPVGVPVELRMISDDVIHSFYIPDFRVKADVLPGRYHRLWFTATKLGRYHLFCAEYCGAGHSRMRGEIIVMSEPNYAEWAAQQEELPAEVVGQRLFEQYGCGDCHPPGRGTLAPSLANLFGREEVLEGGQRIVVDEAYVRESILNPSQKVVAGFQPMMPLFEQLDESDVLALMAYLRTLTEENQE